MADLARSRSTAARVMDAKGVDLVLVPVWAVKRHDQIIARIHTSDDMGHSTQGWERREWIALQRRDGCNLHLDCINLTADADGGQVELSMRGFLLVEHLIRAARVVPPGELKTVVWGSERACSDPTLRAAIHHVRKALPPAWVDCVRTFRLRGYAWLAGDDCDVSTGSVHPGVWPTPGGAPGR